MQRCRCSPTWGAVLDHHAGVNPAAHVEFGGQAQRAYLGIARDDGDGTYIQSVLIEGPDGQFYGSNGDTEVADTLDGLYDRVAETVDRGDVWYVAGGTDDELVLDIEDNLPPADQPQSDPMQDLARALPPQERAELLRILQGETLTEG